MEILIFVLFAALVTTGAVNVVALSDKIRALQRDVDTRLLLLREDLAKFDREVKRPGVLHFSEKERHEIGVYRMLPPAKDAVRRELEDARRAIDAALFELDREERSR